MCLLLRGLTMQLMLLSLRGLKLLPQQYSASLMIIVGIS